MDRSDVVQVTIAVLVPELVNLTLLIFGGVLSCGFGGGGGAGLEDFLVPDEEGEGEGLGEGEGEGDGLGLGLGEGEGEGEGEGGGGGGLTGAFIVY